MKQAISNGYCIRCGAAISFNLTHPFCLICGGACSAANRYSASDEEAGGLYCHVCGHPDYISEKNPVCIDCRQKIQEIK